MKHGRGRSVRMLSLRAGETCHLRSNVRASEDQRDWQQLVLPPGAGQIPRIYAGGHCLFFSPSSKRLPEQFKGRRASPVGVIEMVAWKGPAPRLHKADEMTVEDGRRYQIL